MRSLTCAALFAFATACSCNVDMPPGSDGGTDGGTDAGSDIDIWTAWNEIRAELKKSPDHLVARADEVVASKDPVRIFELVRDQIATYPPADDGFNQAVSYQRWGAKGTLRGGAGTPREKAELLVSLYERAGFTAEVVNGIPDPARLDGQRALFRPIDRTFTFAPTPAQSARWAKALGGMPVAKPVIDADAGATAALAESLKAQLPTTLTSAFDFSLGALPLVKVTIDGGVRYANPLVADATFGESVTMGTPLPVGTAGALDTVRVRLQAARADDPYTRFDLVDHTFTADEVVGRRVQVSFTPPVPMARRAHMRMSDIDAVVPVLQVVGPDVTKAEHERLVEVGDLLTFGGDVIQQTADGGLVINGEELAPLDTDLASLARVQSVQVEARASSFPEVELTVAALDGAGAHVPRLGAAAFEVTENGKPVSFTLRRNELKPRVVLLFDLSTSIPAEFLGANAVSIADQIVTQLYAGSPNALVRIAHVNFGATFESSSWATNVMEASLQAQALMSATGNSDLWNALYDVSQEHPTVVIMITDGDTTDVPNDRFRNAIASGAPVLTIGVGPVMQMKIDEFSALSGGRSVTATMTAEAVTAANAEIAARAMQDYSIRYRASVTGNMTRTVRVIANAKTGMASYTVPATPTTPRALSGLYLTIASGGRERVVPIAGFALGTSTAFPTLTEEMLEDVRATLLGRLSLSVEAAAPPYSVVLDEWLADKLTLKPVIDAAESKDEAAIVAALKKGFAKPVRDLAASMSPLRGAVRPDSLTFETGLRLSTMIQKVHEGSPVTRQLDIFPLSTWKTAAADGRLAWERTLFATASLAVMESQMFSSQSTEEALAGQPVTVVIPGQARDQAGLTEEEKLRWAELELDFSTEYRLIVPVKPGPFWAVHQPSGTVIGLGADGKGTGGAEDVCSAYDFSNSMITLAGLLGSFLEVAELGPWLALAAWEVKYVTIATLVLIGESPGNTDLSNPGLGMGCAAATDAASSAIPYLGLILSGIDVWNTLHPDHGAPTPCSAGQTDPCHP